MGCGAHLAWDVYVLSGLVDCGALFVCAGGAVCPLLPFRERGAGCRSHL